MLIVRSDDCGSDDTPETMETHVVGAEESGIQIGRENDEDDNEEISIASSEEPSLVNPPARGSLLPNEVRVHRLHRADIHPTAPCTVLQEQPREPQDEPEQLALLLGKHSNCTFLYILLVVALGISLVSNVILLQQLSELPSTLVQLRQVLYMDYMDWNLDRNNNNNNNNYGDQGNNNSRHAADPVLGDKKRPSAYCSCNDNDNMVVVARVAAEVQKAKAELEEKWNADFLKLKEAYNMSLQDVNMTRVDKESNKSQVDGNLESTECSDHENEQFQRLWKKHNEILLANKKMESEKTEMLQRARMFEVGLHATVQELRRVCDCAFASDVFLCVFLSESCLSM